MLALASAGACHRAPKVIACDFPGGEVSEEWSTFAVDLETVHLAFEADLATLSPADVALVDTLAQQLQGTSGRIEVIGYPLADGNSPCALCGARTQAVADEFVRAGVPAERFELCEGRVGVAPGTVGFRRRDNIDEFGFVQDVSACAGAR
jgi:hypothetical protein